MPLLSYLFVYSTTFSILLISLFLVVLGLHCCMGFLSLRRVGAPTCCGARGFSCCRARALGKRASVVAAPELSRCGSQWHLGLSFPTLEGRFFTTEQPGKSLFIQSFIYISVNQHIFILYLDCDLTLCCFLCHSNCSGSLVTFRLAPMSL